MKKDSLSCSFCSSLYIQDQIIVHDELIAEAEKIENDPEAMLRFIDWLFLGREEDGTEFPS